MYKEKYPYKVRIFFVVEMGGSEPPCTGLFGANLRA